MLERAFYNLVLNARDAMPGGGQIKVSCYPASTYEDDTDTDEAEDAVVLTLADNGAGMSEEIMEKIFDPFYSTKDDEGTGLGLSMVQGWLATIGGSIKVESQPGSGSMFTLTLPGYHKQQETLARPIAQSAVVKTGRSIEVLVVEDREDVRASMIQILRNHDYIVTGAASGDEALRLVSEMAGLSLVCLDCVMPGMRAIEVIHALRQIRPGLPILLCSGHTSEELIQRGVSSGEFPFLAKPFTTAELLDKVQELTSSDNGH